MSGRFITFEGGEGAGKSSQVERLAAWLAGKGIPVVTTREPGGTPGAEAIRQFILGGFAAELGPRGEAALMSAARADHVDRVIRPALAAGKWVISDRFMDSTRAYQGGPDGADPAFIAALERLAIGPTRPDLTLILDLPVAVGLERARLRRNRESRLPDRFERDDPARHEARRREFLAIAANEPERCVVIDAEPDAEEVALAVLAAVQARLLVPVA